ncbi:MAG TPA: glycosyl hydrolase family 28-related protein, partial [Acidimicrobiales bacterium]|nr:glycosyl hydrolase family 28-related protein [Acidimicrobiales bacterium]
MRFDVTAYPYQAKGDGIADDGPAIQAAIDACARAGTAQYGAAQGTVWFPTGTYRVTGTLYLPQLWSMFSVTLAGEGVDGAIVVKDTPGDLFVADRRPGHAPQAIDLVVRDLALACLPQSSCLTWDMRDVVDWRSGTGRIRLAMSRVRLRCGTGGSSAPAMRLYGGGGVTLRDVWVYGVSGSHGVAFEFERCSRTSLYDCRIMGVPGGLCRFIGSGGTQTLVGCRAEGAYDVPEFLFEDQNSVVLINCGGEGEGESPSQFLFRRCTEVELIDCSPSTADKDPPGGGARPDGIRFEACSGVRVSGGAAPGSYTAQ